VSPIYRPRASSVTFHPRIARQCVGTTNGGRNAASLGLDLLMQARGSKLRLRRHTPKTTTRSWVINRLAIDLMARARSADARSANVGPPDEGPVHPDTRSNAALSKIIA